MQVYKVKIPLKEKKNTFVVTPCKTEEVLKILVKDHKILAKN